MKNISLLFGLLFAATMVGAGCTTTDTAKDPSTQATTNSEEEMMEKEDDAMMEDDKMMEDETMEKEDGEEHGEMMEDEEGMEKEDDAMMEDDAMEKEETSAATEGTYTEYDASQVSTAATNGDAVLFFHASWCPTCKALNDDIEASLDDIPEGLTIFKTDYDSNTDLKKQYGVTYQHTLVQVDADGNMITKWSGGNTLESLTSKVQ